MRLLSLVTLTLALLERTSAIPWVEPLQTPQAYFLQAGVSPRPTEAPGLNGIPKELVRRQQDLIFPPPPDWCGFISGNYDDPLTCRSTYTCVSSLGNLGCCPNSLPCSNIYTTCLEFGEYCGSSCEGNDKVLKCSISSFPYCGTYRFSGGTRLYNCDQTSASAISVELVEDYYLTATRQSLGSATRSSSRSSYTYTPSSSYTSSGGGGLSASTIRNIAIGASVGVCVIFILIAVFVVKRRRANRMKRAAQPSLPPAYTPSAAMQQKPPGSNPAYQPVPQQDQPHPPTQAGYFAPTAAGKHNGTSVTTQPSLSPPASQTPQQRHSAAPSSFLSPNPSDQGRESYYKANGPVSPTITEVDGTGRPLPEADSIERPMSTHQGMMSPMPTGSSPGSPPPLPSMQQHQGQGQVHKGYVAPRVGTHEVPPTQAYAGPYEMPEQRH
ncbi:MAG: hypothetical protein Q9172_007514 [Xanthocarpia lactea]